ncbi:MAG: tetratricopeptide repeat protein [Bacteroidales bacterium]|nr:tetratricopeptide repeat protein [Bacteroidales bacterium]
MKRVISIVFCIFALAYAASAQVQPDRSEVRSGNRAFRKGNFKKADIDYRRALVKDSTSLAANYNLANTLYRMENWQEALKYAETAENTAAGRAAANSADVFYNKGDIALQNKDYNTAVEAFKQSLLLNPGDLDAKENYIYARKMLEDQQNNQQNNQNNDQNQNQNNDRNQDQNQNQDQNKDNNDQNKDNNKDNNNDNKNDQNQNQDQNNDQDQNGDNDKDQNRDNGQGQPPQISPQAAQQMLQAIEDKEKETQEKVKKEKALQAKSRQKEKNW